MIRKKNALGQWIAQMGGRARVAEILGVHISSVRHWDNGRNFPRPAVMAKIRRLSNFTISFDAIVDSQFRGKK